MTASALRIVSLLPALLGTYGDRGNVVVLAQRLRWRGFEVEVVESSAADPMPEGGDLYVLGGAEDDAQAAALELLRGPALGRVVDRGVPLLAVCAGLQLIGTSMRGSGETELRGLGVVDVRTDRLVVRALGETVTEPDPELAVPTLTGFSNHSGATRLGPAARPLGTIVRGPGNAGDGDAHEGALQGSVIGTYLHGPVLARNPALADVLLSRAVGHELPSLPPGPEELLRRERLAPPSARRARRFALASQRREP